MYLNCKTFYSQRYGTFSTEQLVITAKALGITALALTNINGTTDAWEFVSLCREKGIHPVLGCEIRNNNQLLYVLLAKNEKGLQWIHRFLSTYKAEGSHYPARPPQEPEVYVIYPLGSHQPDSLGANELIGVASSRLNKLYYEPVDRFPDKYIICQPVTFQDKEHYHLHRLLRAIELNTLVSKLAPEDLADVGELFLSPGELLRQFARYPAMISRTKEIMDGCGIDTPLYDNTAHQLTGKNKKTFTGNREEDRQLLRRLSFENLPLRYEQPSQVVLDRIESELNVIDTLGFTAYYLIVWDVICYARSRNFFYVGRGSGANSIVAYLLLITEVEPIAFDLYFERFLNGSRSSPPDFDIDFSHTDRDEIITYIFNRYGPDRVALLGMQSTFKQRAALRELGKVAGLPKSEIDQLVANRASIASDGKIQRAIRKYSEMVKGFPNYHSIHAGGMLISELPIHTYTALEFPPKGFATAQIDLFDAERIGLFKLDILSQRGLGHIRDTIQLVKQERGISVDITRVKEFMNDDKVNDRLSRGDTIGCFYIESPAMRQLLTKLECSDYRTLVAASSIIRPGVAQSGMMKQYISRHRDNHEVTYLHPKMKELLHNTFGIMIYQEDVIKVAHQFGGLDRNESDLLRRLMSGKYKGNNPLTQLEEKFFDNCKKRGYPAALSGEVWRQIASFAGFSFSKAHSASFAVESYQSLYLKTYFPIEFMVAVINNFGGFYSTMVYFHELKRTGAKVHAPCVNQSEVYTTLSGTEVYTGFIHVEKLTAGLKNKIIGERKLNGVYTGLHDFIARVAPGIEQLNILIRVGALRFTGITKKELLWTANFLQKRLQEQPAGALLFEEPELEFQLPELSRDPLQDAFDEIELLGFFLGDAFDLIDDELRDTQLANDFQQHIGKEIVIAGQLVCRKESRTKNGETLIFGTFLDADGNFFDTIHWPAALLRYPFRGDGFYCLNGRVIEEFGVCTVQVSAMKKVGWKTAAKN